jgi:hypothetical protein
MLTFVPYFENLWILQHAPGPLILVNKNFIAHATPYVVPRNSQTP